MSQLFKSAEVASDFWLINESFLESDLFIESVTILPSYLFTNKTEVKYNGSSNQKEMKIRALFGVNRVYMQINLKIVQCQCKLCLGKLLLWAEWLTFLLKT